MTFRYKSGIFCVIYQKVAGSFSANGYPRRISFQDPRLRRWLRHDL